MFSLCIRSLDNTETWLSGTTNVANVLLTFDIDVEVVCVVGSGCWGYVHWEVSKGKSEAIGSVLNSKVKQELDPDHSLLVWLEHPDI